MVAVCEASGTQLTFNHQRRFGAPFRAARDLLRAGAIGTLQRMEATCDNLFDWGTHWFDMLFFFNDETPVEWVIGQIDTRKPQTIFWCDRRESGDQPIPLSQRGHRHAADGRQRHSSAHHPVVRR